MEKTIFPAQQIYELLAVSDDLLLVLNVGRFGRNMRLLSLVICLLDFEQVVEGVDLLLSVLVNLLGEILVQLLQIKILILFRLLLFPNKPILIGLVEGIRLLLLGVMLVYFCQQIYYISHCLFGVGFFVILLQNLNDI